MNEQEQGTATYGITHLSDLNGLSFLLFLHLVFVSTYLKKFLEEEFTQYYLNERLSYSQHISSPSLSLKDPLKISPEAFDWRDYNAVTGVKNQVENMIKMLSLKK